MRTRECSKLYRVSKSHDDEDEAFPLAAPQSLMTSLCVVAVSDNELKVKVNIIVDYRSIFFLVVFSCAVRSYLLFRLRLVTSRWCLSSA